MGTHISNNPLPSPFLYKGVISVSSDFPNPLSVKVGWVYAVIQDVTDNDPTKTNTGQSFLLGDEIVWNGLNWTEFGSIDLWFDEGTSLRPINTRDINVNSNNITNIKYSDYLNTFSNPSYQESRVFYDKNKHALSYYNEEPDITVNLGQELLIRVKNETGSVIPNGSVVYPLGVSSGNILVGLANSHESEKCRLVAVATQDIPDGSTGYVTKCGEVGGIDTSSYVSGNILYLSDSVDGGLTTSKPTGGSFITQIAAVKTIDAVNGSIVVDINITEFTVENSQQVGFSPNHYATLSFDDSLRTLIISPTYDSEYDFYQFGEKYTKLTDSIQLPDEDGIFYIYYNLGTLYYIKNPTETQIDTIIRNNPTVSYVYWDATNNQHIYLGNELHRIGMNSNTHAYLHAVLRCRYLFGLQPSNINSDASGNLNTSAQFGIGAGALLDEDLYIPTPLISSTTGLHIYYISGTSANPVLRTVVNPGYSVTNTGTGRLAYNTISAGNWVLAEVDNNNFVCCHVIGTNDNDPNRKVIALVGQNQYSTVSDARLNAQTEIANVKTAGFIPQEVKAIATFIFQTANVYSNDVKARIRSIDSGVDFVDFRAAQILGSSGSAFVTTFSDNQFQIYDGLDQTKIFTFTADNIATGTTRNITVPDKDITLDNITNLTTTDYAAGTIVVSNGSNTTDDYSISTDDEFTADSDYLIPTESTIKSYVGNKFFAIKDPTGFEERRESILSFSISTSRALVTLAVNSPTYTSYNLWFHGDKHIISTTKTILLPDTEGLHAVYFDTDDTLKSILNPGYGELLVLLRDKCIVSLVYWDATNKMIVYDGEERHGTIMDSITHYYLHYTQGLKWIEGLALGSFVIGTGNLDSHSQFSSEAGLVSDEDIGLSISAITSTTGLPILYRLGASGYWRRLSQPGFSCYRGPTFTRLAYNQFTAGAWQLSEVGNGNYVLYHIFATTGVDDSLFSVMGQNVYTTLSAARIGANEEISNLLLGTLPSPEIFPVGTVIYQTGNPSGTNYGNTVNARIVLTDARENYVDWRSNDLPRGTAPTDHGNLTGLSDDDHTQYALADQSRGFSSFSSTVTFTSTEGLNTVTILNGLITNWTQV